MYKHIHSHAHPHTCANRCTHKCLGTRVRTQYSYTNLGRDVFGPFIYPSMRPSSLVLYMGLLGLSFLHTIIPHQPVEVGLATLGDRSSPMLFRFQHNFLHSFHQCTKSTCITSQYSKDPYHCPSPVLTNVEQGHLPQPFDYLKRNHARPWVVFAICCIQRIPMIAPLPTLMHYKGGNLIFQKSDVKHHIAIL